MMLNPKRLCEKMCFKCTLERWHTTTTPDLFRQIVPQTRPQNTKSAVTICHTFRGWHYSYLLSLVTPPGITPIYSPWWHHLALLLFTPPWWHHLVLLLFTLLGDTTWYYSYLLSLVTPPGITPIYCPWWHHLVLLLFTVLGDTTWYYSYLLSLVTPPGITPIYCPWWHHLVLLLFTLLGDTTWYYSYLLSLVTPPGITPIYSPWWHHLVLLMFLLSTRTSCIAHGDIVPHAVNFICGEHKP